MQTCDISVVICTFNRADLLRRALQCASLQETEGEFSYEILIIDDGSTDDTEQVVREAVDALSVPIRYKRTSGKGIAEARNFGIDEARGEFVVFCDDDTFAQPDWLKNLFAVARDRDASCVAGCVRLELPEEQEQTLGPVARALFATYEGSETPKCEGKKLPTTSNLLLRASIVDSIGGFDTTMMQGGSDRDFIARIRSDGFEIWNAPDAVVYHFTPLHRLESRYIRWNALRGGSILAYLRWRDSGIERTLLEALARTGQALLITLPSIAVAAITGNKVQLQDKNCLRWRAEGFVRRTLVLMAPRLFSQEKFFDSLVFRDRPKVPTEIPDAEEKSRSRDLGTGSS